jgi:hypothetical protein
MFRKIIEWLYLRAAINMPLWFSWQWNFVGAARWYFDAKGVPEFYGWPWKWNFKIEGRD